MANKFTNFKFTTEGKDTLTEVLAAKGSIAITQVYTFASNLTDALVFTQLSSLSPKQIKPVGTVSAQSNTVETRLQIDNADLTADYNLQGIALVGTFNKTNFVLGYINTNEATNVPAFSGNQVQTIALDVSFAISDTSVITINTQTAGMLTVADYNALVAFIKDQVAPLSVDKQVVHLTSNEIIDGIKTFKQKITGSISGNANTVDYINIHQITANIDLNTLTTNGNYLSTLETKTTSNKPGGTSEQYTLISTGNIQVFNDIKTDKTYIRNYIKSDTFTSWKVVIEDIDQTLNAQFNFTKVPTVNSKPVAIQADLQTETTNRTNADKTINNSLTTEVSDRKSGDTTNANAIQAETTARSQADSSAAAALNTEKTTRSAADTSLSNNLASEASARSAADVALTNQFNTVNSGLNSESVTRSAADATLTKSVTDTQKQVQTETTNRTNADNKIDSAAVHKTGNESISGVKTFSDTTKFSKQIEGAFSNRTAPFSELSDLITKMATYAGQWRIYTGQVSGLPIGDNQWGVMEVIPYNNSEDGGLLLLYGLKTMDAYIGYTSGSAVQWKKIANDVELVHLSGNETLAGTKTFSSAINGNLSGNASTADKLRTARTIGGVKFDGTANINLPGVNATGNQDTTGKAASADVLNTKHTTFTDISVVTADMITYAGNWAIYSQAIKGIPDIGFGIMEVLPYQGNKTAGIIKISPTDGDVSNYIGMVGNGSNLHWSKLADDSTLVHNTGSENVSGAKIFFDLLTAKSGIVGNVIGSLKGNADTATKLATARTIGGVSFDGTQNINLPGVNTQGNQSTTGNAASASKLLTVRSIGGVNFDGTANINLPGVNTQGNQNTTGNAATATKLQTAHKVNGTPFDGTKDISINAANDSNIVHQSGNESIAGNKTFTGTVTAGGTQLTDSGWKSLTPSVGGTVKYRKVNGIVYVQAGSIPSLNNEGKTLVTLPAGYRPNDTLWTPWYAGNNIGNMTIDSDGSLTKASTNNPGKDQVQISMFISYPADN